jgi:hypothetical protein
MNKWMYTFIGIKDRVGAGRLCNPTGTAWSERCIATGTASSDWCISTATVSSDWCIATRTASSDRCIATRTTSSDGRIATGTASSDRCLYRQGEQSASHQQFSTSNAHKRGGSNSAFCMLEWTHPLPNSSTIIQNLCTDRASSPLICTAVSRIDTEAAMTALCRDYVCCVV